MPAEADPALVEIWAQGWALTREVAAPIAIPGGWRLEVGLPDQVRRFVYPSASQAVAARGLAVDRPFELIKVAAGSDAVRPLLGPAWVFGPPGYMMTRAPMATPARDLPPGYRLTRHPIGEHVTLVKIATTDGAPAASGRIGLVGDVAIYDQIRTEEAHQRRGLGRALMMALGHVANLASATRWTLVATPEGRALYEGLGWAVHAPYTSASIPPV